MADGSKPALLDLAKLAALAADLRKTSLGLTFDQQRSAGVYPALLRAVADGVDQACAELREARHLVFERGESIATLTESLAHETKRAKAAEKREAALAEAVQHEWSLSKGGKGTFDAMKRVAAAVDAVRVAHGVVPADSGAGKG